MKEKIAQMILLGFDGFELNQSSDVAKTLRHYNLGGVILFDYDCQRQSFGRNIVNPEQVKKLTQSLQNFSAQSRFHADQPLLISVDYEGGQVNRLKSEYGFPKTKSFAELATCDPKIIQAEFQSMAVTLVDCGINLNFSPVVDLNNNLKNPIIAKKERAFSADPFIVMTYAQQCIECFSEAGVICALKHFPGHGSSDQDTHHHFVDLTHSWDPIELEPYRRMISVAKPPIEMVVVGHLFHRLLDDTYPATLSHKIMQDLLRDRLNFQGVVASDDLQMRGITERYGIEDVIVRAVQAGCDLLVLGNQLSSKPIAAEQIIDTIYQAVQSGHIQAERILASYARIMLLKERVYRRTMSAQATANPR